MKRVSKILAIVVGALLVMLVTTVLVAQRVSDGPMGPVAGGPLRSGELVSGPVDWSTVKLGEVELQLVEPPRSRITGAFVYEGALYIPCDLGFMWRRVPDTRFRTILGLIWSVKRWHEDAVRDGRVVLRTGGKRYEGQAVRVTDPELLANLRTQLEESGRKYFASQGMGGLRSDVPADPEAIWFFRIDPRAA